MAKKSVESSTVDSMNMGIRTKPKLLNQVQQFIQTQHYNLADEITSVLNRGGKGVRGPMDIL